MTLKAAQLLVPPELAGHAEAALAGDAGPGRKRRKGGDVEGAGSSQLEMPRCPLCREWLVARVLRGGVPGIPCGCGGRGEK